MENHLIRRFPRLLPSSFTLCQTRNEPDIVNTPTLLTKNTQILHHNAKSHKPFSKIHTNSHHINQKINYQNMKNSSSSNSILFSSEENGTFCSFSTESAESFRLIKSAEIKNSSFRCSSEVSVKSIGSILSEKVAEKSYENRSFSKNIAKTNEKLETRKLVFQQASEVPGISADLYYKQNRNRRPRKSTNSQGRRGRGRGRGRRRGKNGDIGLCSIVEKTSSDPYRDFRTSIVEMIVENQIYGVRNLEKLFNCLLSLNSGCYHKVIAQVFSEICHTLYHLCDE